MAAISLAVALLTSGMMAAHPSAADSSLEYRNLNQQRLAIELLQGVAAKDTADLDRALTRLADEWAARTVGQSEVYRRLNVYVPMWTTGVILDLDDERWATCHAWTRYAVPAFLADVETLTAGLSDPTTQLAYLIRRSDVDWATSPALDCELDTEAAEAMVDAVNRYPSLVSGYLDAGAFADDEHRSYLLSVQRQAARQEPVFDVIGRMRSGDRDGALAALAVLAADGGMAWAAAPLSMKLADAYADAGDADRAFAVLDLAARSFSERTLPLGTLRAGYLSADPSRGLARFTRATADPTAPFVLGSARADLSGTFTDVRTGQPVDLSAFEGRQILLDFWSVSCGPCFDEIPALSRLDDIDDLVVVAVSSDVGYGEDPDRVRELAEEHGMDYLVLHDSDDRVLMQRFGVSGWPTHLFVAPDGRLLTEPREGRAQLSLSEVERYLNTKP